jgi:hypothetical protein
MAELYSVLLYLFAACAAVTLHLTIDAIKLFWKEKVKMPYEWSSTGRLRQCRLCKKLLFEDSFRPYDWTVSRGRARCRVCRADVDRRYYYRNRDKILAKNKLPDRKKRLKAQAIQWKKDNPEANLEYGRTHYRRTMQGTTKWLERGRIPQHRTD